MNKPAAIPPRSPGNNWAYWRFNSLNKVPLSKALKRRRARIDFIPTEDALARSQRQHSCTFCHKPVTAFDASKDGKGVRGWLARPSDLQNIKLAHYVCSWGGLLEAVYNPTSANMEKLR